jgi:hypothetical protein
MCTQGMTVPLAYFALTDRNIAWPVSRIHSVSESGKAEFQRS